MAKKNPKVPKGNKFTIPIDLTKRPCFLVMSMIENGQAKPKIVPDKKRKENKESCKRKKNCEE